MQPVHVGIWLMWQNTDRTVKSSVSITKETDSKCIINIQI